MFRFVFEAIFQNPYCKQFYDMLTSKSGKWKQNREHPMCMHMPGRGNGNTPTKQM